MPFFFMRVFRASEREYFCIFLFAPPEILTKIPGMSEGCGIRRKAVVLPSVSDQPRFPVLSDAEPIFLALRGYVWVESIHQIPSGRLGNGMRILEQIS